HTNLEAAIQRAGFSRMNNLSPSGNFKLVILAHGLKDIIVESVSVVADGASVPSIEQGSTFHVSGTGVSADFQDNSGATVTGRKLHVGNLSAAMLADFAAKGGVIQKGGANIAVAAYTLAPEGEGEIEITLTDAFFAGSFQGAYTLKINSDTTVHPTVSFTVNRIISRPKLKQGTAGTAVDADSTTNAIEVTVAGGDITFEEADFAAAIVLTSGRTGSTIEIESGSGTAPTIGTVLVAANGVYAIKAGVLTSGITYKLTLLAPNIVKTDRTNLAPVTYYIKVTG
ncbi:MAG: hypothetical protein LBU25_02250, partial [Treponema sp.]|nr:hypothetical protein [Treponema sp.]